MSGSVQRVGVTPRQREVWDWIISYIQTHDGVSPTIKEVADGLSLAYGPAQRHVQRLVERGWLLRGGKNSPRSLAPVYGPASDNSGSGAGVSDTTTGE